MIEKISGTSATGLQQQSRPRIDRTSQMTGFVPVGGGTGAVPAPYDDGGGVYDEGGGGGGVYDCEGGGGAFSPSGRPQLMQMVAVSRFDV
ncbi:MAG TPA: hypothetical protein VEU30_02995 [Thermoanaerobaculia bacterium]|nr:hypothetical protein [Thermoanaerobaculia bacterium]